MNYVNALGFRSSILSRLVLAATHLSLSLYLVCQPRKAQDEESMRFFIILIGHLPLELLHITGEVQLEEERQRNALGALR